VKTREQIIADINNLRPVNKSVRETVVDYISALQSQARRDALLDAADENKKLKAHRNSLQDSELCWIVNAKVFDAQRIKAEKERDNCTNASAIVIKNQADQIEVLTKQRDALLAIVAVTIKVHKISQGELQVSVDDTESLEYIDLALRDALKPIYFGNQFQNLLTPEQGKE
jgi:hypothetical protein